MNKTENVKRQVLPGVIGQRRQVLELLLELEVQEAQSVNNDCL